MKAITVFVWIVLTWQPAVAMHIPLAPSDVQSALDYGQTHSPSQAVTIPEYSFGSWGDYRPSINITTPWSLLAWQAASAHAKYEEVSAAVIREANTMRTFQVAAQTFGTDLGDNTDGTIVIQQDGKFIHATRLKVDEPDVVENPEVGYRRTIQADFSYKGLDLDAPFVIVVANVMTSQYARGETAYTVDPRTFQ